MQSTTAKTHPATGAHQLPTTDTPAQTAESTGFDDMALQSVGLTPADLEQILGGPKYRGKLNAFTTSFNRLFLEQGAPFAIAHSRGATTFAQSNTTTDLVNVHDVLAVSKVLGARRPDVAVELLARVLADGHCQTPADQQTLSRALYAQLCMEQYQVAQGAILPREESSAAVRTLLCDPKAGSAAKLMLAKLHAGTEPLEQEVAGLEALLRQPNPLVKFDVMGAVVALYRAVAAGQPALTARATALLGVPSAWSQSIVMQASFMAQPLLRPFQAEVSRMLPAGHTLDDFLHDAGPLVLEIATRGIYAHYGAFYVISPTLDAQHRIEIPSAVARPEELHELLRTLAKVHGARQLAAELGAALILQQVGTPQFRSALARDCAAWLDKASANLAHWTCVQLGKTMSGLGLEPEICRRLVTYTRWDLYTPITPDDEYAGEDDDTTADGEDFGVLQPIAQQAPDSKTGTFAPSEGRQLAADAIKRLLNEEASGRVLNDPGLLDMLFIVTDPASGKPLFEANPAGGGPFKMLRATEESVLLDALARLARDHGAPLLAGELAAAYFAGLPAGSAKVAVACAGYLDQAGAVLAGGSRRAVSAALTGSRMVGLVGRGAFSDEQTAPLVEQFARIANDKPGAGAPGQLLPASGLLRAVEKHPAGAAGLLEVAASPFIHVGRIIDEWAVGSPSKFQLFFIELHSGSGVPMFRHDKASEALVAGSNAFLPFVAERWLPFLKEMREKGDEKLETLIAAALASHIDCPPGLRITLLARCDVSPHSRLPLSMQKALYVRLANVPNMAAVAWRMCPDLAEQPIAPALPSQTVISVDKAVKQLKDDHPELHNEIFGTANATGQRLLAAFSGNMLATNHAQTDDYRKEWIQLIRTVAFTGNHELAALVAATLAGAPDTPLPLKIACAQSCAASLSHGSGNLPENMQKAVARALKDEAAAAQALNAICILQPPATATVTVTAVTASSSSGAAQSLLSVNDAVARLRRDHKMLYDQLFDPASGKPLMIHDAASGVLVATREAFGPDFASIRDMFPFLVDKNPELVVVVAAALITAPECTSDQLAVAGASCASSYLNALGNLPPAMQKGVREGVKRHSTGRLSADTTDWLLATIAPLGGAMRPEVRTLVEKLGSGLDELARAAMVHDVGNMFVPANPRAPYGLVEKNGHALITVSAGAMTRQGAATQVGIVLDILEGRLRRKGAARLAAEIAAATTLHTACKLPEIRRLLTFCLKCLEENGAALSAPMKAALSSLRPRCKGDDAALLAKVLQS